MTAGAAGNTCLCQVPCFMGPICPALHNSLWVIIISGPEPTSTRRCVAEPGPDSGP